jgi:hypothetical protein
MNPSEIDARLIWDVAQTLVVGGIGVHLWLVDRQRIRRDQLDALEGRLATRIDGLDDRAEQRLDQHHERIHVVEAQIAARPAPTECAARMQQMTTLAETVRHLPSRQEVKDGDSRAHARIDTLAEGLSEIRGTLQSMKGTLDMIAQPLLSRLGGS